MQTHPRRGLSTTPHRYDVGTEIHKTPKLLFMRKLTAIFTTMILALCLTIQSEAQVRFGIKAGLNVNSLNFNESVFHADNRAGFTGGLMMEFTVPLIGIGADLSAMYVRRDAQWMAENDIQKSNRDYIEIPLNLKYKIGIPVISKIVTPFVTTGPSVSFLTSKRAIGDAWTNNKVDWAWNFGFGVQLLSKVQVAASYGLGLTNTLHAIGKNTDNAGIDSKNRYWTITAAYLF